MLLVTGGCGFIGSAFLLDWLAQSDEPVLNLDLLTYAGQPENLRDLDDDPRYRFIRGDIGDLALVGELLRENQPRAILHFAAETHVDGSIAGPDAFIQTNALGTFHLLKAALAHWQSLPTEAAQAFRFVNVSTDEVYGSLAPGEAPFNEQDRYEPNNPYSASKAAADHFARAWCRTFGLPVITTNCSNNYGPRQFPEKLVPLILRNALADKPISIYGDGRQVRDWLHVSDHCRALRLVLAGGKPGGTYNIGGRSERTNLEVVHQVCEVLDAMRPRPSGRHAELIRHVQDRPGHDRRYAMDDGKIHRELGWQPTIAFEEGLRSTIEWYLSQEDWIETVTTHARRHWIEQLQSPDEDAP